MAAIAGLVLSGRVTPALTGVAIAGVPAMITGSLLGLRVHGRLSERQFRRVALGVMIGTSLVALGGALARLV